MRFYSGGYSGAQYCPAQLRKRAKHLAVRIPELMKQTGAQAIVVTGKSGISLAFATLMLIDFPLVVVRKEEENAHGSSVEGLDGVDVDKYLILDDFVASGATVRRVVDKLERYGFTGDPVADADLVALTCVGVVMYAEREDYAAREFGSVRLPLFGAEQ